MIYVMPGKSIIFTDKILAMENTVTRQFVLLSLHPEKGRITIRNTYFRYSLIGACLMDLLLKGEISISDKRLTHSFRRNGDILHDKIADIIERSPRPKRFSYWIRKLSMKSRLIFRDTIDSLVSGGIIRHEKKFFLNIIPYNRYYFNDVSRRNDLIEVLRGILLYGRESTKEQMMIISLLKASSATQILAREKEEKRILKKKSTELLKKDELSSEMDKVIREVNAAIASSVAVSAATSHGIH
jgi:hypothetical protein